MDENLISKFDMDSFLKDLCPGDLLLELGNLRMIVVITSVTETVTRYFAIFSGDSRFSPYFSSYKHHRTGFPKAAWKIIRKNEYS